MTIIIILPDLKISLQITAIREIDNKNQVNTRSNQYDSIYLDSGCLTPKTFVAQTFEAGCLTSRLLMLKTFNAKTFDYGDI